MQMQLQLNISKNDLIELMTLAIGLHGGGQWDEAEKAYRRILAIVPDCTEAHFTLANLLRELGRLDEAAASYKRSLVLRPNLAEGHNNLGLVLMDQGKLNEAASCYEQALAIKPDYAEAHNNLGIVRMEQRCFEEAAVRYRRALTLKPDIAEAHNNLGILLMEHGQLHDAAAHYEQALIVKPDYAEAHYNLAEMTAIRRGDAIHRNLEELVKGIDHFPETRRTYIHFAFAKALDDIGEYPRAFEQLLRGNALKRKELGYDEAGTLNMFQLIPEAFQRGDLDQLRGVGDPSRRPIFVLGMPRSGSTLIEQILACHPDVFGGGEMNLLNIVANSGSTPFPSCISTLDVHDLRRLGEAYLSSLPELPSGKSRITDKRPLNFLLVGLIHLILPNACIIHTVRDPIDTCLSCFSKLFTHEMQFTYNMEELGHYYRHYHGLMAYWRTVLPPNAMLDVSYELMVGNLEQQTRRLLDYCDLSWNDRCLDFHTSTRPITTASAVQVRRPLYRTSIKRWHRYREHLRPLFDELYGGQSCSSSELTFTPTPPDFTVGSFDVSSEMYSVHEGRPLHRAA